MELLAGQELSSGQLYERLNRRYTQQTSAAVVAEMVQREYINDARYAETRAHALLAAKRAVAPLPRIYGRRGWPQARSSRRWMLFTPPMFPARTRSWKPPPLWWKGITAKLEAGRRDLVIAALQRRGFSYSVIKEAIRRIEEE